MNVQADLCIYHSKRLEFDCFIMSYSRNVVRPVYLNGFLKICLSFFLSFVSLFVLSFSFISFFFLTVNVKLKHPTNNLSRNMRKPVFGVSGEVRH